MNRLIFLGVIFVGWTMVSIDWFVCHVFKECRAESHKVYEKLFFKGQESIPIFTELSFLNYRVLQDELIRPSTHRFAVSLIQRRGETRKVSEERIEEIKFLLEPYFDLKRFDFNIVLSEEAVSKENMYDLVRYQKIKP